MVLRGLLASECGIATAVHEGHGMNQERFTTLMAVVTDPTRREQLALAKAADVAQRSGASLILLNVFMIPQVTPDTHRDTQEAIIGAAKRERLTQLKRLAAPLQQRGIKCTCIVQWDYPIHAAIVRQVLEHRPDVVFAASHRHGPIARWLLTNTDWELIRSCPCPVWFVRKAKLGAKPRILVAVDPRHTHAKPARLDARLVQAAASVREQVGGRLSVAHAFQSTPTLQGSALVHMPVFLEDTQKMVNGLASRYDIPAEDQHVVTGDTREVLASLAERLKTEVLVMGAVSRSVEAPTIGNTAERVIDAVDCDLLVVKPAGFKTPVRRARRRAPA